MAYAEKVLDFPIDSTAREIETHSAAMGLEPKFPRAAFSF